MNDPNYTRDIKRGPRVANENGNQPVYYWMVPNDQRIPHPPVHQQARRINEEFIYSGCGWQREHFLFLSDDSKINKYPKILSKNPA